MKDLEPSIPSLMIGAFHKKRILGVVLGIGVNSLHSLGLLRCGLNTTLPNPKTWLSPIMSGQYLGPITSMKAKISILKAAWVWNFDC